MDRELLYTDRSPEDLWQLAERCAERMWMGSWEAYRPDAKFVASEWEEEIAMIHGLLAGAEGAVETFYETASFPHSKYAWIIDSYCPHLYAITKSVYVFEGGEMVREGLMESDQAYQVRMLDPNQPAPDISLLLGETIFGMDPEEAEERHETPPKTSNDFRLPNLSSETGGGSADQAPWV